MPAAATCVVSSPAPYWIRTAATVALEWLRPSGVSGAFRALAAVPLDRVLVVGSFLRKDHPLAAQRLRQAGRKGAEISLLHSVADDSRIRLAHSFVAVPSLLPHALAEIVVAAAQGAQQV